MACRPAPWAPISAARSGTAAVWIERSTRRWWSPRSARLWLCNSVRRVTRCGASTEGRAAMASGVRTAHGVPPSTLGSDQRSSVGYSRGVDRSSDRLAVGGHRVCAIRPLRIRLIGMAAAMGAKHHKRWYTGVIHTHARTAPAVCWIKLIHVDPQCPYTDYTTRTPRMRDSPSANPFDWNGGGHGCETS